MTQTTFVATQPFEETFKRLQDAFLSGVYLSETTGLAKEHEMRLKKHFNLLR